VKSASAYRSWAHLGCCCAALTLFGCPQVLDDEFANTGDLPEMGAGSGGAAGAVGGAGASETGGGAGGLGGNGGSAGQGGPLPAGSCVDGEQNQDETETDCGGVCIPCDCSFGPFGEVVQVEGIGTDDRFGPVLSNDGRWLYFSVTTTANPEDLFRARRGANGFSYTDLEPVASINTNSLEGSPFLADRDLTLYFFSDRAGGLGSRDLWVATRGSVAEDFGGARLVDGVNSSALDLLPRLTPDGLTLFFQSTREGGSGSADIWAAERPAPTGAFGAPVPRDDLNTPSREEGLTLTSDGLTMVLTSTRGGDLDLWMGTRSTRTGSFGDFELVSELNTAADELDPTLSSDGRDIYFSSTRDGDWRIYHAARECQ
jgi:hypothetical protein